MIFNMEGLAYHSLGRYEEAIAAFERARARGPKAPGPLVFLALTYADMGRMEEARAAAQEVLKLTPSFSAKGFVNGLLDYKDRAKSERALATLRQLGLTEDQPLKLPDKPSIAVLAFQNMSDDPSQEYFADGMAEDIITDLSKISALFVIARNSSFQYKGQTVDVKRVGRELGVRYVLEGSVRRAGDQVRISAQLIDTETGGHLWAERYDGQLSDVFALQDKVTGRIIEALSLTLGVAEKALLADHGTNNIDAHDAFLRGQSYARQYTAEGATLAIAHYTRALVLDPNYERAQEALAQIRFIERNSGLR
jgi:adenylate cyclase